MNGTTRLRPHTQKDLSTNLMIWDDNGSEKRRLRPHTEELSPVKTYLFLNKARTQKQHKLRYRSKQTAKIKVWILETTKLKVPMKNKTKKMNVWILKTTNMEVPINKRKNAGMDPKGIKHEGTN